MSVSEVKDLFYEATNAKIVLGHDEGFAEKTLRNAVNLSKTLTDEIWPFITAYRLAHLLFRKAKSQAEFNEIIELSEKSEKSSSLYISIHSKFLKFSALNRLKMLGAKDIEEQQKLCLEELVTRIGHLQQLSNDTGYFNRPIQGEYFNIVEYLIYNSDVDFDYPIGIGYDENNVLFPRRTNDVWKLVGPNGSLDEFIYNNELGRLELNRYVTEGEAFGWFILGGNEGTIFKNNSSKPIRSPQKTRLLFKIIKSGSTGVQASELAKLWHGGESPDDSGKKARQDLARFFDRKDLFFRTSKGRAGSSWALKKGARIYGLVNINDLG